MFGGSPQLTKDSTGVQQMLLNCCPSVSRILNKATCNKCKRIILAVELCRPQGTPLLTRIFRLSLVLNCSPALQPFQGHCTKGLSGLAISRLSVSVHTRLPFFPERKMQKDNFVLEKAQVLTDAFGRWHWDGIWQVAPVYRQHDVG